MDYRTTAKSPRRLFPRRLWGRGKTALALLVVFISASVPAARADVFDIPEAAHDRLVYDLPISNSSAFDSNPINYLVDNSASIAAGSFSRVGYYMELQPVGGGATSYAYASFDAGSISGIASQLGVPNVASGEFYNQPVTNMNVLSNVPGVATGLGISTGTIQFWPSNYAGVNGSGFFNYADTNTNTGSGYGHMEIGNTAAQQSILTFSNWNGANGNQNNNVGIGNNPSGNPDYTFANNAGNFQVKELQIVVNNSPLIAPHAPAAIVSQDSTLSNYDLVYHLSIPTAANLNASSVPYIQNYSAAENVAPGTFDRVAYVMELHNSNTGADQWVSVSFNSSGFATDVSKIGLPNVASGEIYNQAISDLHVASNVNGVTTGDHMTGGTLQFWPSNYAGVNGSSTFTSSDTNYNGTPGYGHMEIGNGANTIFAYNAWGTGGTGDLGIGNGPGQNTDWTFANTAGNWTEKDLYILVKPIPEPASLVLLGLGALGLFVAARRRRAV